MRLDDEIGNQHFRGGKAENEILLLILKLSGFKHVGESAIETNN